MENRLEKRGRIYNVKKEGFFRCSNDWTGMREREEIERLKAPNLHKTDIKSDTTSFGKRQKKSLHMPS